MIRVQPLSKDKLMPVHVMLQLETRPAHQLNALQLKETPKLADK